MNVAAAREWVRQFASDAEDDALYSDAEIDRAIQYVGQRFCRATRCLRLAGAVSLTPNSTILPLSVPVSAGFRPERLIDAFVAGQAKPLAIIDYTDLNGRAAELPRAGVPLALAFLDPATAEVYPTPDVAYTVKLRFWLPFTHWTPGVSETTELNLPEDYLPSLLSDGAPAVLKSASAETAFASAAWQRYLLYEQQMKGAGNLGARVVERNRDASTSAERVLRGEWLI